MEISTEKRGSENFSGRIFMSFDLMKTGIRLAALELVPTSSHRAPYFIAVDILVLKVMEVRVHVCLTLGILLYPGILTRILLGF